MTGTALIRCSIIICAISVTGVPDSAVTNCLVMISLARMVTSLVILYQNAGYSCRKLVVLPCKRIMAEP